MDINLKERDLKLLLNQCIFAIHEYVFNSSELPMKVTLAKVVAF